MSRGWGQGDGLGHFRATSACCPGPMAAGAAICEQTVLGVRDSKEPKVRSMPPPALPPEATGSWGQEGEGTGHSNSAVSASKGPLAKEKIHSIRGRNGAFNGQTQPVTPFLGKNQTLVEIPHTLTSPFWFLQDQRENGLQEKNKKQGVSSSLPLTQLTPETGMTRPAPGLRWPPFCTGVPG